VRGALAYKPRAGLTKKFTAETQSSQRKQLEVMRLTRRQLITAIGRAGGYGAAFASMQAMGLLAPPLRGEQEFEIPAGAGKNTKIVILGAGIAGLVSAYEMRQAGFDCTVLEARGRPGGRNWTIRGGTKVEFADGTAQNCEFDSGLYMNAGPGRLPAIYPTMLGYCRELGVPLEVEMNTSRSALLQNDAALDGKPVQMRQAVNDTRGHVSELLAKSIQKGALDDEVSAEDKERMLAFLREYGNLDFALAYRGSERAGVTQLPGAGEVMERIREPLPMHALLDSDFWSGMLFEEELDQQATMFQPVGGMDRIPYAFAQSLGPIVKFNSPVREIRKTARGVRIVYADGANGGATREMEADYCICSLPIPILQQTPNDFSERVTNALVGLRYDQAYKIAWEAPRFWEREYQIYGGISWLTRGPIGLVWYPSGGLFSEKGILLPGYEFTSARLGAASTLEAKFAASRAAVETLHPGHGKDLTKPLYVAWGQIPYSLGGWISIANLAGGYWSGPYHEFIVPDDRIYFAGDHCSHVVGWQEGAALSARRAITMIVERMRAA
jgi:monoamine oxidase